MASGCPVLLNPTSDLAQYTIDGENAIVIPDHSIESIKAGLKRIVNLSDFDKKQMKRCAEETARSKFDYRNYKTEMADFVSKLV